MITFEEYLQKHPKVSRKRAESMLEYRCFFREDDGINYALLPGEGYSGDPLWVDVDNLVCDCNVFRTKKACPHVAAALGFIEKNGGRFIETEPVSHCHECLQRLKESRAVSSDQTTFKGDIFPFLSKLPEEEKAPFLLELADYLQQPDTKLTASHFVDCYRGMAGYYSAMKVKQLYKKRKKYLNAVVALIKNAYRTPFDDAETAIIVREIAADEALTAKYISDLAESYASYFTREQLLAYYKTADKRNIPLGWVSKLAERFVEEEPPRYEDYLYIFDNSVDSRFIDISVSAIEKLIQAGYGDRLKKVIDNYVCRMHDINDYHKIIQLIPHEQFFAAWKNRKAAKNGWFSSRYDEWEMEIDFRENPETSPEDFYLDELSPHLLEVILQTRPEYRKQILNIVRKQYRSAVKKEHFGDAKEALMVLIRANDEIAVKYACEWEDEQMLGEDLVYLAAVGVRFNCLEKVAPQLKKMEITDVTGQN